MLLFCESIIWIFTAIRQAGCMQPLMYQYNTHFLEKTQLNITMELEQLAEAMTEGMAQINNIDTFLKLNTAKTQQQQSEGQANEEQPGPSSDRCNALSESLEEPTDKKPLLCE